MGPQLEPFHPRVGAQHLVRGVASWSGVSGEVASEGVSGLLGLGEPSLSGLWPGPEGAAGGAWVPSGERGAVAGLSSRGLVMWRPLWGPGSAPGTE